MPINVVSIGLVKLTLIVFCVYVEERIEVSWLNV